MPWRHLEKMVLVPVFSLACQNTQESEVVSILPGCLSFSSSREKQNKTKQLDTHYCSWVNRVNGLDLNY